MHCWGWYRVAIVMNLNAIVYTAHYVCVRVCVCVCGGGGGGGGGIIGTQTHRICPPRSAESALQFARQ